MRKLFIVLVSAFILLNFYACSGSSETVVAEYGNDSITMDEFKEAYEKNLTDSNESLTDTTKDKKEFLDLFVNYKMKLSDAHARGFDTNPEIQKEVDDYMRTVGIPYVQEKYVIDPGLKDLYEKRKHERKVKHILIRKKGADDPEAEARAQALLDSILAGADFESVAFNNSEDQFSKPDSGSISWLTAGQTIPPFDEAIFNAEVGKVYPEVVKTSFGYHIIKVDSEQTRKYEVKARHILAAFQKDGEVDSAAALEKIKLVEQKLKEGEGFAELAKEYSDDPGSAAKGGELGYFRRRMMIEPFDEAAFTLGVGEVSDPIKTKYGYHIIEVQDIKDYPSYEDEEDNLKKLYEKNYFPYYADKYLDTLKQEYNFEMNDSVYAKLKNEGGDLVFNTTYWESDLNKEIGDSTLYSFNNNKYSVDEVITDIDSMHTLRNAKMTANNVERAVQDQLGDRLYIQKAMDLNNGDTEFAQLMEDYQKGLYIFKLQEEEIWNKLDNDSTKLVAYYEQTKDNYVMPDRASFSVIFRKDSSVIYDDYFAIQDGAVFDTIVAKNLKLPAYKKNTGVRELTSVEESKLAAEAFELENPGDISEPFKVDNGWYIVKLISKDPKRIKTFEEARSEVSSAWMEKESKRLEAAYLNKLKELYHPKLYYDKLSEMDSDQTDK